MLTYTEIEERLEQNAQGCMIWNGAKDDNGYSRYRVNNKRIGNHNLSVHVYLWERLNGKLPEGKCLHHICGVRPCCNLEHLSLKERGEHLKEHKIKRWVEATHCPHGHGWTDTNTYIIPKTGYRICKVCRAIYMKKYKKERRK